MVYSNSNNVGDGTNMTPNDKNAAAMDRLQREEDWQSKNGLSGSTASAAASPSPLVENEIWPITWTVWMRIATAATETTVVESPVNPPPTTTTSNSSTTGAEDRRRREYPLQQHHQSLQHKQKFLTALLQIFPLIFTRIKARFVTLSVSGCILYYVWCRVILLGTFFFVMGVVNLRILIQLTKKP